ncbi:ABC transporter ATP-binding protein [Polynucleobacter paneuropaeus]|nr:ABC transporter ATP-binding protein [Polynucleobacter paneuropaeus]
MPEIIIDSLTIDYPVYGIKSNSIKNAILSKATGGILVSEPNDTLTIRALDNFTMHAVDGDRIGLVGHNGSGKSTLLRAICGIYKASKGTISVSGSIGALIDVGAGFDPESTGIENIYLRGYLYGKSKHDIANKVNEIIDFTELEEFINLPIRTYSAGMVTRLAFAISTAWQHDILIIDEGIGAGDKSFQDKAQKRIENLFECCSILVMATHSEDLIGRYCNRIVELSSVI